MKVEERHFCVCQRPECGMHPGWIMSPDRCHLLKNKNLSALHQPEGKNDDVKLYIGNRFFFSFCLLYPWESFGSKQDYNTVLKPRDHWQEDRSRFFIMQREKAWQIKYTPFIAGFLICQSSKRAGETNFVNYSIKRPSEPAFTTQKPGSNPAQRNAVILMSLVSPLPAVTNREHIPLTVLPYYLLCQKWFNVSQHLVCKM